MKKQAGILLVDDHAILREGLARLIDQESDMHVCGQAGDSHEALRLLEELKPDLAIVDISLGGSHGLELIKDIKARWPRLPVLVLSMHDEALFAERALRAGARGYIMKQVPSVELLASLRRVLRGKYYLSETMTRQLLGQFADGQHAKGTSPLARLSNREFEVLELIGRGNRTRQIAQQIHVSVKTVQSHREHIKEKLRLQDAVSLVRFAVQWVESQKEQ
ncbi:MAG: response regulator transcription factor [Candidatus Omnitrophica bacterium]|nr:response regulator transcription factor [Candidatus Omnitrophota bacterium]